MRKFFFALFLCGVMLSAEASVEYQFKHYSVKDGLSQNTVMAILQDHKGFMWFGTWDGLNKFDGNQFTIYKSYPGDNSAISTNRIDFLYEDKNHFIWMQTYDGSYHRFDPRTETFQSLPNKTEIRRGKYCFLEAEDQTIWIVTNNQGLMSVSSNPENGLMQITQYGPGEEHGLTNDTVHFVIQDARGTIWVGTEHGLNSIDKNKNVKSYFPNLEKHKNSFLVAKQTENHIWLGSKDGVLWRYSYADEKFERIFLGKETQITDIAIIHNRYIIATTQNEGFFVYDTNSQQIKNFSTHNTSAITSNNIFTVTVDSYGVAWFEGEQSGIIRYIPETASLKHFQPKVDAVHKESVQRNLVIFEDTNNKLWINPQGGGFSYYDREADELKPFFNEPGSEDCRFSNVIHTAFADKDNNLWISTYNKGIEKIINIETQFQEIKVDKRENTLTSNEVRAIQETSGGIIWVATKEGITRCYNSLMHEIGTLCENGRIATNPSGKIFSKLVYTIHEDSKKRIWLGTKGDGIYLLTPKSALPNLSYSIQHFYHENDNPHSLSNNNIYDITEDSEGNIWIGTYGGGLNKLQGGISTEPNFLHSKNGLSFYPTIVGAKIRCLLVDSQNTLWVGTTDGLFQIEQKDDQYTLYHSKKTPGNPTCLGDNNVHYLHQDTHGTIWMGTFGGGLNKLIKRATADSLAEFKAYTTHINGSYNDIVLCIVEDKFSNLWMSSENTISRFDVANDILQSFNVLMGSSDSYFSEAAGIMLSTEKMLFGSNRGLYTFNPLNVLRSDAVPEIEFTRFQLFNEDCPIDKPGSPLKKSIGFTSTIELTHKQSVFSIEYAALDMANPSRIQYAFILEGFEKNWNYVQHQRKATYTNIPKGTYHFKVKSTNKDGIWVNNDTVLTIIVHPSFWQTPLAYILYTIVLVIILFSFYYFSMKLSKKNMEVEIEKQVTDNKLKFFTNISHELRTPLSLILGPVEHILKKEKISEEVREELLVVESNANRMLRLVNQILDFRKIQNKKMRLKIQPTLLDTFVRTICSNFEKEAHERNIEFTIQSNLTKESILWVDQDKFDIILYNLLSNAFKFTPDNKKITVILEEIEETILLKVTDEGIGISKDRYSTVFNRFASTGEVQRMGDFIIQSSGIGLHLVKELVDLHNGTIEVDSTENEGTTFTIHFNKGNKHFDGTEVDFIISDEAGKAATENKNLTILSHQNALHIPSITPTNKPQITMLIVEDNVDMREFLLSIFKNTYKTLVAEDGKEALEVALETIPDIIVTDLMMPHMDGLELTSHLKKDERTSHIPIILLTAKSAVENRLEALHVGADDYITKPFSPVYLEARIENMLEQRQKLQEHYRTDLLKLNPKKIEKEGVSPEEAFLAKLMDFMERNMDNNNLSVEDLVSEMALGRTVFFNKLKGLTGLSPVEFIREIRIKRAAQLLEDDRYNVTEITYMVGMNDSRYFSKCFKTAYGITPSEYKRNLKAQREDNK